ncbi:NAD(P)/FAD-dependent oxidoreductase [uncultured Selenomonas sp.]|uniref:NAD(P)/FAD-dependent oxidoreductase n=1 Tax=uncultured Selenomonas sp. TaxID=159275 RepID=UPI0025D39D6A|nr:NAD(P)/FAD-dependent oxidoreductase [uncultured Selenomonas sp.]
MEKAAEIVIVGAGIGGVRAAQEFAGKPGVHVTLIDRNNYQLFPPLLYQVSTATLATGEIAFPVREFFRDCDNVDFCLGDVTGFDTKGKAVLTKDRCIPYDALIIATGSTTNFFGNENVAKHAFPMKTMQEALDIRNQLIRCLELADQESDPVRRKELLTFVCVGGGPTGVEEAGAISELIYKSMRRDYHHLDFSEVDIKILEGSPRLLAMMPEKLSEDTANLLRKKKVDVRLQTIVTDYDGHTLTLKSGEKIQAATVIWAAGVKAQPVVAALDADYDRGGRIIVNKDLSVKGLPHVYAIGDSASFVPEPGARPLATVAPVAMKQGIRCAQNILAKLEGCEPETFVYKDMGAMATIGRSSAVLATGKLQMKGFLAWSAWLWVHLIRLAGTYANVSVALKWVLNYFNNARLGRIIVER